MIRMSKKKFFNLLQLFFDVIAVYFSYSAVIYLKSFFGNPYDKANILSIKTFIPYVIIAYLILFFIYRLYEVGGVDFYETFLGILFSSLIIFILGFALSFFLRAFAVPRTVIIYSFILQLVFLSLSHWVVNKVFIKLTPPLNALLISKDENESLAVSEYLKVLWSGKTDVKIILTDTDNLLQSIEDVIDKFDIFVIDDSFSTYEKEEFLKFFAYKNKNKPVYIVPGVYELLVLNPETHFINDLTLLEINLVNISGFERLAKRLIDIFVSLVALIVFSPVMLVVSIAILLEDGRPIFYLQKRLGVNGKTFKTIKFRTMIKDAEKFTGAVLSTENDRRITKVGRFLRKTGLDEVPQFINVLIGDMSVVGPRPERPEFMEKIRSETPNFDLRLKVKPGITGFAQLYGKYDTPFEAKLKMDLLYAKQRHPILTDIYIMFNTVKLFLSPHKRK
jgi:exopolysaccharide biosynthesis polyprenyl glycosylphosphotransferase